MVEVECGGFVFTSNFESGNFARVEQVQLPPKPPPLQGQNASISDAPDYEFNIWTNPDCAGTEYENSSRSWFYFGIRGGTPFTLVKLNLVNLNRQVKMYSQGMAPVFRILPGRGLWDRIRDKPTYTIEDSVFTLSFRYRTLENVRATTYFAFTFPYSYQDLMSSLRNFDKRFKNCTPPEKYFPGQSIGVNADDVYYHRELACHSLDGRRLDLITITSHHGITPDREPRLKNLFPDLDTPRPYVFVGKKVIFISARVHPGEVPSSYVLNGFLESLLNREDLTSVLLRRMYVFKIIPMLNPDGVARGHFRTDTRGVNLNRVYLNPSLTLHPTIYAARAVLKYAHFGKEIDDDVSFHTDHVDGGSAVLTSSPTVDEDLDMNCNPSLPGPLPSSYSSPNILNMTRSPLISSHESDGNQQESYSGNSVSTNDKYNTIMQCDSSQPADEDMINSDYNTTCQGNADPVEMEVEKEKLENEIDPLPPVKNNLCLNSFQDALDCDEEREISDLLRAQSEAEVSPEDETKEASEVRCEQTVLRRTAALSAPSDDFAAREDSSRRRDPKRKPVSSGPSKPMRLFIRPLSRNEDEIKDDESQFNNCSANIHVGSWQNGVKPSLDPSKSGLFLYMDMHGHASKKGIFMYGNHFDEIEQLVECMLLPKLMSINSQNFHFTACNFTERNMYLRDRRDGMSREGCGRVSVMKMTGLVRSYTLECNYNTGRMVNLLPPCVRDSGRMSVNPAYGAPPKYTPLVFEDVGRALGISVLDLTNSNPCSRVPNSEYRSINGIRDWLRSNCLSDSQLWTRMLHRPTRQQVAQSTNSHSVAGPSGHKHVHLTKSVLLARISSELKTLGEEYARKEHLRMQRTASCSQLDTLDAGSNIQPKENIGPGQYGSRSRRLGEQVPVQLKASHSGVLQQRSKTLTTANLTSSSRKKIKSSGSGNDGPLRPVAKAKTLRRAKTQITAVENRSSSGDSLPVVYDETENAQPDGKCPSNTELIASSKRFKISSKTGKQKHKHGAWRIKCAVEENKSENQGELLQLPWPANRNTASPMLSKKVSGLGKLEKISPAESGKFRSTVTTKVKAVRTLSHLGPTSFGENSELMVDTSPSYINFADKLQGSKDLKLTTAEGSKQGSNVLTGRNCIRSKSSNRNLLVKTRKIDLAVPGPSTADPCLLNGTKGEPKFKTTVLRSLEKGNKSRLLCPVRRRNSEGNRAWKSLERKPTNVENSSIQSASTSKIEVVEPSCANLDA